MQRSEAVELAVRVHLTNARVVEAVRHGLLKAAAGGQWPADDAMLYGPLCRTRGAQAAGLRLGLRHLVVGRGPVHHARGQDPVREHAKRLAGDDSLTNRIGTGGLGFGGE